MENLVAIWILAGAGVALAAFATAKAWWRYQLEARRNEMLFELAKDLLLKFFNRNHQNI